MDKRTLLAFGLIGLVVVVWVFFNSQNAAQQRQQALADSMAAAKNAPAQPKPTAPTPTQQNTTPTNAPLPASYAAVRATSDRYTTIESPLYRATINSHGGTLARMELKNYRTWNGAPVQLVDDTPGFPGVLALGWQTPTGETVDGSQLDFTVEPQGNVALKENDSVVVTTTLTLPDTAGTPRTLVRKYLFRGNSYGIGMEVAANGMGNSIAGNALDLSWRGGVKYQEHNSVDESGRTKTVAKINDELVEVDAGDAGSTHEEKLNGSINWVGTHAKYFGAAIIPATTGSVNSGTVRATARVADSNGRVEKHDIALRIPTGTTQRFTVYAGPMDNRIAKEFGLEDMVEMGMRFLIRPIAEYVLLPIFRFLNSFIPNWGLVIIVFSILIRAALWPLSAPQIRNSRKMQILQPKMTEIREKYKDDQQRQQMETMRVYQEYGVNPAGGCLPMLLQMPILYALWGTFSSAIELRQAGFVLWINDLSIPDTIIQLPFSFPLLGTNISGLALIMCAATFLQQRTMVTDPRQKAMFYAMPIMLLLVFNGLPSGLNLYYLVFTIVSIAQYYYMANFSKNTITLEQLKATAKTKKKGWLARKMEEAQQMAAMQQQGGRNGSANGKSAVSGRTPVENTKKK